MKQIIYGLLMFAAFNASATQNCEKLSQNSAKAIAKLNKAAIGRILTEVKSTKLISMEESKNHSNTHATYEVVLTDGKKMDLKFSVNTNKENDEYGICSVESVNMEPVFF